MWRINTEKGPFYIEGHVISKSGTLSQGVKYAHLK